jgi:signal transduction histidine kinase
LLAPGVAGIMVAWGCCLGLEGAARRDAAWVLGAGLVVAAAIAAAQLAEQVPTQRFFDNVHWTAAYVSAALLAWRGALRRSDDDRITGLWFAWALTAYAIGQVLWDLQVATGWNPFPGPSDVFFVCLGLFCGLGLFRHLRRTASPGQLRTARLDIASLSVAVLALTLALYLPRRGDQSLLPMAFMVAYPVVLCWAACVGVILVLTLHLAPAPGWIAFLFALLVNGALWLEWNSLTLDAALADGTLYNSAFSVTALVQGTGALLWRTERSDSRGWRLTSEALLRLLPLFNVILSATALLVVYTLPNVPQVVVATALGGALVVVVLSSFRQAVSLEEREQLIAAERTLRKQEQTLRGLEAQLVQAQKLEAVGSLAAGVAHDFNNLLAAIRGNAELLRNALRSTPMPLRYVSEIDAAVERAASLVRQILAFSRPHQLNVSSVSIHAIAQEVVQLLRATLPAGIELTLEAPDTTLRVSADATQLHQVLVNLATNAAQAIESKVGRIDLRIDRDGDDVCISVRDTGKGMDAQTRERIFEPFFTTKPTGQGTGLGLSVVHGILRSHKGSIEVDSAPGAGTTFRVRLPVSSESEANDEAHRASEPPRTELRKRVLYVDDEASIVSVMKQLFALRGYETIGFDSAPAALDFVRQQPQGFDVVITDYNMPKMTGVDFLRAVQQVRSDAPFVLMSGHIDERLQADAQRLGVRHLIQKPQSFDELCNAIER